jgi:hypothetical protein
VVSIIWVATGDMKSTAVNRRRENDDRLFLICRDSSMAIMAGYKISEPLERAASS